VQQLQGSCNRSSPLSARIAIFFLGVQPSQGWGTPGSPLSARIAICLFVVCKAGFLECTTYKDRAIDHRHSQLELLFSFFGCNPHRDGALQVCHSQLELLVLVCGVQGWRRLVQLTVRQVTSRTMLWSYPLWPLLSFH